MEQLRYVIEDSTIAQLLGVQNFTNDESAVLELIKNAYDAKATVVKLVFNEDQLIVTDSGSGMDADDIKQHWMHIGKSAKVYDVVDKNNRQRILAGSKGVGRFALARLGKHVQIFSKKDSCAGVKWETDWNSCVLSEDDSLSESGTRIVITGLREKWNKKKVENLISFLSKTYNDNAMSITISHPDISANVPAYFPAPVLGKNCLSLINLCYDSSCQTLSTKVISDEFASTAIKYCNGIDIQNFHSEISMVDELAASSEWELSTSELQDCLSKLGNFSATFYFGIKPTKVDVEKFLYKHADLPDSLPGGIILYRNAFSISAYEGKKDWLGLGKRSRKSPAAATHPTGAWRVRENQIAGKVEIDKRRNAVLQDLSNRQGLDENIFYDLFVEIILAGLKEFERYRQNIIRHINVKNEKELVPPSTPISDKVISNPKSVSRLTVDEAKQLASEIKNYQKDKTDAQKEKASVESRYKYDVRILNVLATVGLKASSIAHEMKNDRNSIAENTNSIIAALKEYGMWQELHSPDKTSKVYKNVPYLLESNSSVSVKILAFMNTMLSEIEKKQFEPSWQSIGDILNRIKHNWERDYAWISINITLDDDICFSISEDVLQVIFDNLILNSIQQNEAKNHLCITIAVRESQGLLCFEYTDDGKGLDKKYLENPRKILEVHETTRKNGHGLGMWIVNNTAVMSGGRIDQIKSQPGFSIEFTVGGTI